MPKHAYSLYVYYPSEHRSLGLDEKIEASIGKISSGSGTDFKERDLDFGLDTQADAEKGIIELATFLPPGSKVQLMHYRDLQDHSSVDIIPKSDVGQAAAEITSQALQSNTPRAQGLRGRHGL